MCPVKLQFAIILFEKECNLLSVISDRSGFGSLLQKLPFSLGVVERYQARTPVPYWWLDVYPTLDLARSLAALLASDS